RAVPRAGGLPDAAGGGRRSGPRAARARDAEPRRARPDAAANRRARALPLDPRPVGAAGDHADGARRGGRPDRRPRARRRRLRDEAVLAARARRAGPHRPPPRGARRGEGRADRGRRAGDRRRETGGPEGRRAAPVDDDRVRAAVVLREPPEPRLLARPADGARLGLHERARHGHRHRSHPAPAPEDRGRPVTPTAPRDGLGRRLPVHAVVDIALVLAAATLGVGIVAAFALRLLPTVRLQIAGLALLAVVLPLAAVLASGWVMFHMGDDVKILGVAAASALVRRSRGRASSPISAGRSTRWRRTSRASSTPSATSSPRRATTCGHRS